MFEDLSLLEGLHHGLCQAVERDGAICFGKKKARGYCQKHYDRLRLYGSVNLPEKKQRKCKFIDCIGDHWGKGYCKSHYGKFVEYPKNKNKKCSIDTCNRLRNTNKKFCGMHNMRLHRHGSTEGSGERQGGHSRFKAGHKNFRDKPFKVCIVPNCNKDSNAGKITKGLCQKHYQRWRSHGDYNVVLQKGSNNVRHKELMD